MYKYIKKWSNFIMNETLKTNYIDFVIKNVSSELNLSHIKNDMHKDNNRIELTLYNFYKLHNINIVLNYIDSLMIDRNGWFPSKYILYNLKNMKNELIYDDKYLKNNYKNIEKVIITYEPKYDIIEPNIPDKLYHLSIQEYKDNTLKYGLFPKSKNKQTKHLDRIFVCKYVDDCYLLIPRMLNNYTYTISKNKLNKINYKWIIYEIDTKDLNINLYKDPNYIDKGYYIIDNIKPEKIKIYDIEK
ncbi:hypothetical protein M0Q97_01395 [Candidatus Dojkabacteria bacterium]|jgi:hypothetical protein|nr:hypothetical protein [Candidatus Dojkabacteria bacterium]